MISEHRWNAKRVSAYKYGGSLWWSKKSRWEHYLWLEKREWREDGNSEHVVNIINYLTWLEMYDGVNTREEREEWEKRYEEEKYVGTDSEGSVSRFDGKRVSELLRERLLAR